MAEKMMPYALRMTLAVLANKPDDARSFLPSASPR